MVNVEKLISIARELSSQRAKQAEAAIYEKMTLEQLRELAYGNPSEQRIKEIFTLVDGLHLLEKE